MSKKSGVCKLTGEYGQFIKSHLIPQALTKPEIKGAIMREIGDGFRAKKATSSWYDPEIVTRSGEDILTYYDTAAVTELRKHKLVWSSWKDENLPKDDVEEINEDYSLRHIEGINTDLLRLFILSLVWRSCVTKKSGFEEISLPEDDLNKIREMLINKNPGEYYYFPIILTQLSTKGEIHNQAPSKNIFRSNPSIDEKSEEYEIFRFYFDGLIAHIRLTKDKEITRGQNNLILGYSESLLALTITYDTSFQKQNFEAVKERHFYELNNNLLK
ncbi:hypothetical protein [Acinetobacter soli]